MQFSPSRIAAGGVVIAAALAAHAGAATADPVATITARQAPAPAPPRRHELYLEALGKGGLWGVGYAFHLRPWLAVGAVGSFALVDGQRITTFAPYAELYPVRRGHHGWFVDVGPQLVHLATPSPVPEWNGTSDFGIGAELSTGYEYRARILVRGYAMVSAGTEGIAPWLGLDVGWTL